MRWPIVSAESQLDDVRVGVKGYTARLDQLGSKADVSIGVLRGWAADAVDVVGRWDTLTAGQKDAVMKATIGRVGLLCSELADVLAYVVPGQN